MGKSVDDARFVKMLKEVSSGYWDILNFTYNRGSEYIVTFVEEANAANKERVRVSARLARALGSFVLDDTKADPVKKAA